MDRELPPARVLVDAHLDRRWLIILPIALAVIAHVEALGNGFTSWDDPLYLARNPLTEAPLAEGWRGLLLTPRLGYPVPVTVLFFAAQRAAFGLEPAGFHTVSLALHVGAVALAAVLARRLGASWRGAAIGASLFAVHPIAVEPIAWVTGQKDLLSALFMLAALVVRAGPRGDERGRTALTFAFTALSIAAKPSTVLAPLLLAGVDLVRGRSLRRPSTLALYGAVAALAAASVWFAIDGHRALGLGSTERIGGRSLVLAAWSFELQLAHLVWPATLVARYFPPSGPELYALAAVGAIAAIALVAAVVVAWRKGHRAVAFGLAAPLLAYAPAGGIIPLARGPADSYVYLPLALAIVAIAIGLSRAFATDRRRLPPRLIFTAGVLCTLLMVSRVQGGMWLDSFTLWSTAAEASPGEPSALVRVAGAMVGRGDPAQGLALYEQIAREYPDYTEVDAALAGGLAAVGRWVDADRAFARAVARTNDRATRETYAFFLVTSTVDPQDHEVARTALRELAPLLATRGRKAPTVHRAIELCDLLGMTAEATALRARLAELQAR